MEVEQLVAGGEGLARFEGIPLFVPRSAPGDRLRVRLVERHPDYGRAEIVEVLAPGAGQASPLPLFRASAGAATSSTSRTGGRWRLKAAAVRETLRRLGGLRAARRVEVVAGDAVGLPAAHPAAPKPARGGRHGSATIAGPPPAGAGGELPHPGAGAGGAGAGAGPPKVAGSRRRGASTCWPGTTGGW